MPYQPNWRRFAAPAAWAVTGAALLWLEPVLAKSAGEIGAHLAGQGENLGKAVSALAYVGGMGSGAIAFYKFKSNRENPQQHPIGHAFGWGAVCAGLLFLPQTFKTSGDTLYGPEATQNDPKGTTIIGN